MKKIMLFLLFFSMPLFYSQPGPPPLFKIQYTLFGENKNSFLKNFDVVATRFRPSFEFRGCGDEFNGNIQVRNIDSSCLYVYLYNQDGRFQEKNDVVQLSIQQKKTGKIMSLFIPADYISKEMGINNLRFMEGNYLYGLQTPDKKYEGHFILDDRRNYNLSIADPEDHKISLPELNALLTEICRND